MYTVTAEKSVLFSTDNSYIFDVKHLNYRPGYGTSSSPNANSSTVAVSGSNNRISLYGLDKLNYLGSIANAHEGKIGEITPHSNQPGLLMSCGADKKINIWDLRTFSLTPAISIKTKHVLNCISSNSDGNLVAVGSEMDVDANVIVQDIRNPGVNVREYTDFHNDDVTQVLFHPLLNNVLLSGSTDGVVCVIDVAENDLDDSVKAAMTSESSVQKLGFFGREYENISCITHIETLLTWSLQGNTLCNYGDVRKECAKNGISIDYCISANSNSSGELQLFAGDQEGSFYSFQVSDDHQIIPEYSFRNGHKDIVRSVSVNDNVVISGSEDSLLTLWRAESFNDSFNGKIKSDKSSNKYMPY